MESQLPYAVALDLLNPSKSAPKAAISQSASKDAEAALGTLLRCAEPLELFGNVERDDDIQAALPVAQSLAENTSTIFVLGIGGSSLGGQALAEIAPAPGSARPRVVFLDNPDPFTYERALAAAELRTTRFLAVSKSGSTAETLAQTLIAAEAIKEGVGAKHLKQHFAVITEPKPSALRTFAEEIACSILDHPLGVGGRYSVLTIVGLLPAILMGLDVKALRAGARAVLHAASSPMSAPVLGAALHWTLMREGALKETVLWPYCDRLKTLGAWWRQLWAESLGKNGKGTTPVAALGPVDQHSQLQLFLDGPGGTLFTFLDTATAGRGARIPAEDANRLGAAYLGGRRLGDLVDAELRATAQTLAGHGRPVRQIRVPRLDERAMGALFMHFMLETILTGRLMGVDPFDQPAVEEGKVLARKYLDAKKP
jgi:glucose-6-phosphate isomerase